MALPASSIVRRLPVSTVLAQFDTKKGTETESEDEGVNYPVSGSRSFDIHVISSGVTLASQTLAFTETRQARFHDIHAVHGSSRRHPEHTLEVARQVTLITEAHRERHICERLHAGARSE